MVTKQTPTDEKCCRMKSVGGYCPKPLEHASEFLSKKWTISIIITIGNFRNLRFTDLKERMEKATAKILSQRLKELKSEGLIERIAYDEVPPRVEYNLTRKGNQLLNVLVPLITWAEKQN